MKTRPTIGRAAAAIGLALSMIGSMPALAAAPAKKGEQAEPPAAAAAPEAERPPRASTEPQSEQELEEIRRLYDEGKAKYDTFDYGGAIDLWTKAYAKVEPTEDNREIRNNLVYNIATAQEKAYDLDGDVAHLRQAKGLLERYVDEYKSLYRPTPQGREEVAKVEARIAEIDARIAEAEGAAPATAQPPPEPEIDPEEAAEEAREKRYEDILHNDPEISRAYKTGRGMIIGGSVMLGVGGMMALGAGAYAYQNDLSGPPRAATISVGVVGGAIAIGGAVLLGLGIPKRKRAKESAREKAATMSGGPPSARVVVSPTLGASGVGLQVGGRF